MSENGSEHMITDADLLEGVSEDGDVEHQGPGDPGEQDAVMQSTVVAGPWGNKDVAVKDPCRRDRVGGGAAPPKG